MTNQFLRQGFGTLPFCDGTPVFPQFAPDPQDAFLRHLSKASGKWMIAVDDAGIPRLAFNTDAFLRAALFDGEKFDPVAQYHVPIVAQQDETRLDVVIRRLCTNRREGNQASIRNDLILL